MTAVPGSLVVADAFSVRDRVTLVTGAAGLIGSGVAEAFAANGARVIVSDREAAPLEAVASRVRGETGGEVEMCVADLREPGDLRRLVAFAGERYGRLDVLIHAGAVVSSDPLLAEAEENFERLFETNVRSAFLLAKYAVPLLEKGGGSVINIASVNGHRALFPCPLYSGTKAALITMSAAFAAELGEKQIRFNTISPGLIPHDDRYLDHVAGLLHLPHAEAIVGRFREEHRQYILSSQPLPVRGAAYDVAMACIYLASPAARFVTGADLLVDGGKLHMFESQQRSIGGKGFWGRVREALLALPDDAWKGDKPEWLTRPRTR